MRGGCAGVMQCREMRREVCAGETTSNAQGDAQH